jgi:hypothetical protein
MLVFHMEVSRAVSQVGIADVFEPMVCRWSRTLILNKRQPSVSVRRPFVNLFLQSAFGEALPEPSSHVGDVDAVVGLVMLQADAFAEALGDLRDVSQ